MASPQAVAAFRVQALERSRGAAAQGLLQRVDWSRGQEGRSGQATADAKQEQSKADAGSPSDCDFPTAERFRSSGVPAAINARKTIGVGPVFNENRTDTNYPQCPDKELRSQGYRPESPAFLAV